MKEDTMDEIREDTKIRSPAQTSNQFTPPPNFPPNAQMPNVDNIDDTQIEMMKNMMKDSSSRDMMRNMMKSQYGMDVSDEHLNMMAGMMNKETIKMASQQAKSGQAFAPPQNRSANTNSNTPGQVSTQQTSQSVSNNQAESMNEQPNMDEMMKGMANGQQPDVESLMKNKDMIKMVFQMLKTNPAMMRAMTAQLGESNPVSKFLKNKSDQELMKLATWLEKLTNGFMFCWPAIRVVKNNYKTILCLLAAYVVYRYI